MKSANLFWRRAKLPLAVSLASTLASPAFAVSFNIGEIEGQFDSSLSIGASWSTANPNKNLIGVNNGGKGLSQTSDDGHLNLSSRAFMTWSSSTATPVCSCAASTGTTSN